MNEQNHLRIPLTTTQSILGLYRSESMSGKKTRSINRFYSIFSTLRKEATFMWILFGIAGHKKKKQKNWKLSSKNQKRSHTQTQFLGKEIWCERQSKLNEVVGINYHFSDHLIASVMDEGSVLVIRASINSRGKSIVSHFGVENAVELPGGFSAMPKKKVHCRRKVFAFWVFVTFNALRYRVDASQIRSA